MTTIHLHQNIGTEIIECYSVQDLLKLAQKLTSQSSSFVEKRTQEEIDLEVGVLYPVDFKTLPRDTQENILRIDNDPDTQWVDAKDFVKQYI
ncbi:MAG: hypothetical protein U9Q15_04070 [Patescibacteria group bacterium]|nr:hypothetical protein [Patescibacteria group bacterium]